MARLRAILLHEMEVALSRGDLRVSIPATDLADLLLGLVQGTVLRWQLSGREFDLSAEGRRLVACQIRLLATEEYEENMKRIFYVLAPALLAVAATVWLVSNAEPPARTPQPERVVPARTMVVTLREMHLTVSGYGSVRPAWSWQATTEVGGTITYRHPNLETGKIIPAGTKVLEIDTTPYLFAKRQVEADLATLTVDRDQIELDRSQTSAILDIERQRLALAKRDLERVRVLLETGAAPQSRVDDLERATLTNAARCSGNSRTPSHSYQRKRPA